MSAVLKLGSPALGAGMETEGAIKRTGATKQSADLQL